MKKEEIKSLEEAFEFIAGQEATIETLTAEKKCAEDIAKDAVDQLNEAINAGPKQYVVVVDKKKVKVNFGVEGLNKEQLSKDKKLISALIKKGSSAVTVMED
ncbi:hypothetical protein BDE36_1783 [Arcticibacter tournemirensis]|uniref:Uncharacterized protein n=1 Tax=Arcticibacter tournemirensis TaxID=699437 RepID=A0A5M9H9Z5_9SPHI|nr:hypothetical protein [Arcticibacter tournemirensis]KAA8483753.1 hypothetical protein F1649_07645 [Arcticibacter tournemirensis]TQM50048.1 hypothetical protein BDE36_1783 [Arcticibacter tournemirensis]